MEERSGRSNTVLLTVIGAATLLVVVVGATFAYFSAQLGGSTTSTIDINTSDLGTTRIVFPVSNEITIDGGGALGQDLPYSQKGTVVSESMYFALDTTSEVDLDYRIYFRNMVNEFCQYVGSVDDTVCKTTSGICSDTNITDPLACTGDNTWTNYVDVRDEVTYRLEQCITPTKTGEQITCTDLGASGEEDDYEVIVDDTNAPVSKVGDTAIVSRATLPAASYQMYKLTVMLKNTEENQNYNSDKELHSIVRVDLLDMGY